MFFDHFGRLFGRTRIVDGLWRWAEINLSPPSYSLAFQWCEITDVVVFLLLQNSLYCIVSVSWKRAISSDRLRQAFPFLFSPPFHTSDNLSPAFSCLFSSACHSNVGSLCHDLDHRRKNNKFLADTASPLGLNLHDIDNIASSFQSNREDSPAGEGTEKVVQLCRRPLIFYFNFMAQ